MLVGNHDCKMLSVIILVGLAFIVALITNIGSIVLIVKLGLKPDTNIFDLSHKGNELTINQDTYLDKVFVSNKIKGLENIYGNSHFSASSSNSPAQNRGAHISLMDDRLTIQARHLVMNDANGFRQPLSLESLNQATILPGLASLSSPNGISNLKRIASPIGGDLRLESNSNLLLSGNLGLRAIATQLSLHSQDMTLYSRESDIVIAAPRGGIRLPLLSVGGHNATTTNNFEDTTTSLLSLYQLCICRNGRLFKIRKRADSDSCTNARFPISDNPCS